MTADVKLEFSEFQCRVIMESFSPHYSAAEEVEGGSLNILVKYKYIPVMNKKKDLCNIPDILADSCPLQPGVHEATFIQKFPSHAPYVSSTLLHSLFKAYPDTNGTVGSSYFSEVFQFQQELFLGRKVSSLQERP